MVVGAEVTLGAGVTVGFGVTVGCGVVVGAGVTGATCGRSRDGPVPPCVIAAGFTGRLRNGKLWPGGSRESLPAGD